MDLQRIAWYWFNLDESRCLWQAVTIIMYRLIQYNTWNFLGR